MRSIFKQEKNKVFKIMKYYNNILETIGETPLVKINNIAKDIPALVLGKLEYFNPGNSIKDRIGVALVEDAEKRGLIQPGGTFVEATSGNTGMGIALAALVKGYQCVFTMTSKVSVEKIDILRAIGAEVIVCPYDVAPEDPRSYYSMAATIAAERPNAFNMNQYDNLANRLAHYESTGPEIWRQTEGKITHLVVTAGTCGTVSGTAQYLKEMNPNVKVWAIDAYGSVLKKYHETQVVDPNENYSYLAEGFGKDTVPDNLDISVIDHFEKVGDTVGMMMCRRLASEEGMFLGISAGYTMQGLLQLSDTLTKDDVVVMIFHDHGSRYVKKVYSDEWMKEKGLM